jgi:DNA-binding transcriptional LysR family regulator
MHTNKNPQYFLAIAAEGSFSKAAERLYVSQSYLSQHVLRLEKEFGVSLLDRSQTPLQLTEAGRVYVNYLESGRRLEQKLLSDFAELSRDREQTLRLALSSWRAGVLLPDVLPIYSERYPQVRMDVQEYPTSELYRLVLDERADLAVMNTSLDTPEGITVETIMHERILLAGNRRNKVTQAFLAARERGGSVDLHALENERVILMRPGTFLANRVRNFLDKEQVALRRVTYSTNAATALGLAARDYGFCFLNETGVRAAPGGGELAFFGFDTPDMAHPLCAVYKSGSYLRPIARAFIDAATEFYKKDSVR